MAGRDIGTPQGLVTAPRRARPAPAELVPVLCEGSKEPGIDPGHVFATCLSCGGELIMHYDGVLVSHNRNITIGQASELIATLRSELDRSDLGYPGEFSDAQFDAAHDVVARLLANGEPRVYAGDFVADSTRRILRAISEAAA